MTGSEGANMTLCLHIKKHTFCRYLGATMSKDGRSDEDLKK